MVALDKTGSWGLLAFLLLFLLIHESCIYEKRLEPTQVNLAIRRSVDLLLRDAGDSVSQIPPVEHPSVGMWRLRVDHTFDYDLLPEVLQSSFELYKIQEHYEVALRRCQDDLLELGFNKLDVQSGKWIPCQGREGTSNCYVVEIVFPYINNGLFSSTQYFWWAIGVLCCSFGWFMFRRSTGKTVQRSEGIMVFGNSTFDVNGQLLNSGGERYSLTFREAKLLQVLVENMERVVERDYLIQSVWVEEGVLVSRSLDVFVSRLRKKLSNDDSVSIVAVHGVGYRFQKQAQKEIKGP
jgi:DNA-binding winged helix-turn-helix (wHTH) protein